MTCTIDGCEKPIDYKERKICQMHYFRYMRNGTYNTVQSRNYRISTPHGYQKIHEPDCPLINSDGYIYEHRFVVFQEYGYNLPPCELCAKPTNWDTCHVDHIDEDVTNNNLDNLRPLCGACNIMRGRIKNPEHSYAHHSAITYNGKTMTAAEWARKEYINVAGATILRRMRMGATTEEALFSPRVTHHNTKTKVKTMREWKR